MSAAAYAWSWADVPGLVVPPPVRRPVRHGGASRPSGKHSRFVGTSAHADRQSASLSPDHAAVREGRTLFPTMVFDADEAPRVLVSGHNSAKIGARVTKGPWRGLALYTLTLEERATCPQTCSLLLECFGNAMPFSRRVRPGPALIETLEAELHALTRKHPRGFGVRLHVLGDFYDLEYVRTWATWLAAMPALHVFGFTAHPAESEIGREIAAARDTWPGRWAIRSSVPPDATPKPGQATTIWRQPEGSMVPEGLICPAQTHRTDACGTCGLCWHPTAWDRRIVFIGHGMNRRGRTTSAQAAE